MHEQAAYVRREFIAPAPPPAMAAGVAGWLRQRLFGGIFNAALTLFGGLLLIVLIPPAVRFLILEIGRAHV